MNQVAKSFHINERLTSFFQRPKQTFHKQLRFSYVNTKCRRLKCLGFFGDKCSYFSFTHDKKLTIHLSQHGSNQFLLLSGVKWQGSLLLINDVIVLDCFCQDSVEWHCIQTIIICQECSSINCNQQYAVYYVQMLLLKPFLQSYCLVPY